MLKACLNSTGFSHIHHPGFQKKFQTHPPKPAEVEPSLRKVSLPPANHVLHYVIQKDGAHDLVLPPAGPRPLTLALPLTNPSTDRRDTAIRAGIAGSGNETSRRPS